MSALTEKVAREHVLTYRDEETCDWVCNCGLSIPADLEHIEHIAAVTEQAVRAQVAAQIRNLEYTREQADEHVRLGGTVTDTQWYDIAVEYAAQIAEGEQ